MKMRFPVFRLVLGLALLGLPMPAAATDFVVTRYDDPAPDGCLADDCSLREAVLTANEEASLDRIVLSAGTYALTRIGLDSTSLVGDLDIESEIEIEGPGAPMTILDGAPLGASVFESMVNVGIGKLTLRGVTLAGHAHGGLRPQGGDLVVEACVVRDTGGIGALFATGGSQVTVRDSTFSGNVNGITASGSTVLDLSNVTIEGSAINALSVSEGPTLTCTHCTVVGEVGTDTEIEAGEASIDFVGSLVVGECVVLTGGSIDSLGGNLESPGTSCGFEQPTDLEGVADPGLSGLADHGGPTPTIDLDADAPALGLVPFASCGEADQRGVERIGHALVDCDAGSVERDVAPPTPIFHDGFEQGHAGAWPVG